MVCFICVKDTMIILFSVKALLLICSASFDRPIGLLERMPIQENLELSEVVREHIRAIREEYKDEISELSKVPLGPLDERSRESKLARGSFKTVLV